MFEIKLRGGKVLLNAEKLKESVPGLNEDQLKGFSDLIGNVFSEKIADVHSGYDKTFMDKLGLPAKPVDSKSYEHWANEALKFKTSLDSSKTDLQSKIDNHVLEISNLKKQIEEGKGDEALKTEITSLKSQLTEKENTLTELRGDKDKEVKEWEEKYNKEVQSNKDFKVSSRMAAIEAGLVRKKGVSESDATAVIRNARQEIRNELGVEIEGEELVFKKDGKDYRNPNNARHPYKYTELLHEKLSGSSLFDFEKTGGGGTVPPGGQGGGGSHGISLGEIKTKRDFTAATTEALRAKGIPAGSEKAQIIEKELREEYNVEELPLK